ncbi:TRAP transporter small permease [Natronorubrum sp. A-ect3]|uniref:TRAP transporter small permease n=1 Tax=Natronorubrum sp. A-ect3 TaxID=3242698 RepID=UPI00359D5625
MSIKSKAQLREYENLFNKWFEILDSISELIWKISLLLTAGMVVLITLQVFTRYLIGWTPVWGSTLSTYIAIWVALLLIGPLVWRDQHLQVEFIFKRLSDSSKRRIRSIQLLLIVFIGVELITYGLEYALNLGTASVSSTIGVQMIWFYLSIPVSGLSIVVFSLSKLIQINLNPNQLESDHQMRYGNVEMENEGQR